MVSRRVRGNQTVGTRLAALQENVATLQAKARTAAEGDEKTRLALIEAQLELLSSANYRLEEEYSTLDARYGGSTTLLALPDPWLYASSGTGLNIAGSAATWTDINSNFESVWVLTRPLWVSVEMSANITGAASTYGMIGVDASGALVLGPETGLDGTVSKFGYTGYGEQSASGGKTITAQKVLLLPAGTTTLKMQTRRNVTTGTPVMSYPTMTVTPIMWDDIAVAAPTLSSALTKRSISATQNFAASDTTIDWDLAVADSGHFTFNTSTDAFTCVAGGQYRLTLGLGGGQVASANWIKGVILVNSVAVAELIGNRETVGGRVYSTTVTVNLNPGDIVTTTQSSSSAGGALTAATSRTYIELVPVTSHIATSSVGNPVVGRAERATNQSVANGSTYVQQTGLSSTELTGDISFSSSAFTVLRAGLYLIDAKIVYASNATGNRTISVYKNAADTLNSSILVTNTAGNSTPVAMTTTTRLAIGDVLDLRGWQSSGGALNATYAALNVTRISD